jgi:serine/threonine-protein kinase OSR1/STK39
MYNNDRTVKARTVPNDRHTANAGGATTTSSSVDILTTGSTTGATGIDPTSTTRSNFQNEENQNNTHNNDASNRNASTSCCTSSSISRWETLSDYEWPVDATSYRLMGKVGRGASATVYKAQTLRPFPIAADWKPCKDSKDRGGNGNGEVQQQNEEQDSPRGQDHIANLQTDRTYNLHEDISGGGSNEESHTADAGNNNNGLLVQTKYCAIKVINLEHVDTNFMDIRQEVQTMRLSQNENILSCYTSFIHHTNLWLVMQLMDKGSSLRCIQQAKIVYHPMNHDWQRKQQRLEDKDLAGIMSNKPTTIDLEYHITYILHQTILGLQYIHSHGQIHRDIKASNILLDSSASVRIADFGVSGWLIHAGSKRENTRTFVGTPCWMAPEVMEQIHGYDTKADIWSLGITALELAKGYAPYAKYPPMKVLLMTIQDDPPGFESYPPEEDEVKDVYHHSYNLHLGDNNMENGQLLDKGLTAQPSCYSFTGGRRVGQPQGDVPCTWSNSFQSMVNWCLQKDPTKRPNCEELLNHEHFQIFLKDENLIKSYKQKFKEEICDWIPDVGDEIALPGTGVTSDVNVEKNAEKATGFIQENLQQSNKGGSSLPVCVVSTVEDDNLSSGTTWIFKDGSQVTVKSHTVDVDNCENNNSVLSGKIVSVEGTANSDNQDFFDQFERATQGEDFRHPSSNADHETKSLKESQINNSNDSKDNREGPEHQNTTDDLNAFMDQFEMETSGENFLNRV